MPETCKLEVDWSAFMNCKIKNGNLAEFEQRWTEMLRDFVQQDWKPDETLLEDRYRANLNLCPAMKLHLDDYDRRVNIDGEPKSYERLQRYVQVCLKTKNNRKTEEAMRAWLDGNSTGRGGSAYVMTEEDEDEVYAVSEVTKMPRGHCSFYWKTGKCRKGDACEWNHDVVNPNRKSCLLYTSDAADEYAVCRSRWSPYH